MAEPEYSIGLKSPGGAWERVGSGALSSVVPEGIEHTHALPGGPERLSFSLKRDGRIFLPDELPFTEVACMLGGVPCWSGRLMRSPRSRAQESVVSMVAEGWATSHLQDYPIDREWVVDDLSRFVDQRQAPDAALGSSLFYAAAQVQSGDGTITLANPNGTVLATGGKAGVFMDLGANNLARRIVVTYESSNFAANTSLTVGSGNTACVYGAGHIGGGGGAVIANNAGAAGTATVTPSTPSRYVHLGLWATLGHTTGGDEWFKITSVKVFTDAADESGNASILKASTVIGEALALAPRISTDTSGITATSFSIPAYGTGGRRAIADVINDVNNYHQYQFLLTPDITPRPIYRPVPTTPTYVIRESDAYHYDDAGANEGAEIIDTCILQYTDASGVPAESIATASGTILSRVGYSRAKVLQARSKMTAAAALQIAQAYVAAHQSSPMKGKINVKGTIERYADGARIPVGLITAGDAVVLASETNPDTGAPGRIGIIQKVTYRHDDLAVDLELDSSRTYLDALLERYGVVTR